MPSHDRRVGIPPSARSRVVSHPSSPEPTAATSAPPAEPTRPQTLTRRGDSWIVDGEELFNGCFLEVRLAAPRRWLQVWVEGLPASPSARIAIDSHREVAIPLADGDAVQWPRNGIDGSLVDHLRLERADQRYRDAYSQTNATKPK